MDWQTLRIILFVVFIMVCCGGMMGGMMGGMKSRRKKPEHDAEQGSTGRTERDM